MAEKKILIVSFDTPYPTNYGGVFDVMARARFFESVGYKLDLVCLTRDENRNQQMDVWNRDKGLFSQIFYIKYSTSLLKLLSPKPFAAVIRQGKIPNLLRENLKKNQYEFIIVEHLKTVEFARQISVFSNSKMFLRIHNNEREYSINMFKYSSNILKKIFHILESLKYCWYQKKIFRMEIFKKLYFISNEDIISTGLKVSNNIVLLPICYDFKKTEEYSSISRRFFGNCVDFLYVGNLESDDNILSVDDALKFTAEVMGNKKFKVVIAGRCRDLRRQSKIVSQIERTMHCEIVFNASDEEISSLYATTKFFLNFSRNSGGVKTKLIHAISHGIICISDANGVKGSGLEELIIPSTLRSKSLILSLLECSNQYQEFVDRASREVSVKQGKVLEIYKREFSRVGN